MVSLSSCSSSCAILASRAVMEALYLDFTVPSISCSFTLSSLFCRSSCCLAFSFFCAWLRSRFRSVLIWSIYRGKTGEPEVGWGRRKELEDLLGPGAQNLRLPR